VTINEKFFKTVERKERGGKQGGKRGEEIERGRSEGGKRGNAKRLEFSKWGGVQMYGQTYEHKDVQMYGCMDVYTE
jgi:hypothetical protein